MLYLGKAFFVFSEHGLVDCKIGDIIRSSSLTVSLRSTVRKKYLIITVVVASFFVALFLLVGGFIFQPNRVESGSIADKISSVSIEQDNLLIFSIILNEASSSLQRKIKDANLDLPPVELFDSELSYKSPGRSWIVVSDDLILITLYRDVLSSLNADEVQGVALHELGHVALGHRISPLSMEQRVVQIEIDADNFAVESGINPKIMISAINKLSPDNDERTQRISALAMLQKNLNQAP